jgi:hypothetical protein
MSESKLSLTLKNPKTILNKIVCNEKIDINILEKLINSTLLKNEFDNPFRRIFFKKGEREQLIKYKALIDDNGNANVEYSKSKGMRYGRVYPKGSLGLFMLRKELRHTLAKNYYVDIDIENCFPVVLSQICEANGLENKYIKRYVNKRDDIIKQIMHKFNIVREDAKKIPIRILHDDNLTDILSMYNCSFDDFSKDDKLINFLIDLEKNKNIITKAININNPKLKAELIEAKNKKKIKDSSVVSYFLQEYENHILACVYNYLCENNYIINNDCVLCADGIMISNKKYNDELLIKLSDEVFNKIGLRVNFVKKDMDKHYLNILDDNQNKNDTIENNINMTICESDLEASEIIYNRIKHRLVYCYKTIYYKNDNIWLNSEKEIEASILDIVMNSNIFKINDKDKIKPYVQNYTSAKNITKTIIETFAMKNSDDSFYNKFTTSTKGKLCFKNGVLNLTNKKFTKWCDIKQDDQVYTTFYITRDYNEDRNEEIIKTVYNNVFKAVYDDHVERALHFLSRAMGGYVEDKIWGLFIGRRNCGKGVIEHFFKSAFQRYIGTLSSDLFMFERHGSAINDTKKLSWLMELEFARITFAQEATTDDEDKNKNIKIDGTKIKKICSGGDMHKARKNYENEREFGIQSTLMFSANNFPEISPKDTLEFVCSFSSTKQFKSNEFIKNRIQEGANEKEIMLYYEADPLIKEKCNSVEWCDALIHILIDNFKSSSVLQLDVFNDKDDNNNIFDKFFDDFKITNNYDDKVDNKTLKEWSEVNKFSYIKNIKPLLLTWKCKEYRTNSCRGMCGLKYIKNSNSSNDEQE